MNPQINALLGQAFHYFEQGNLDAAEPILLNILQMHAKNFDALHILGVIKAMRNDQQEAIKLFRKAISIETNNNFLHFNLAKALTEVGKNEEAIAHHKKAVQLAPGHVEAWLNYGVSLASLGRYEEALACYEKIFALEPRFPKAWVNYGTVFYKLERYQDALAAYDKALALLPDNAESWSNSGAALAKLERYQAAIGAYEKALSLNPQLGETWLNYGIALRNLDRFSEAHTAYTEALKLDPDLEQLYGEWMSCKMTMCDWRDFASATQHLCAQIKAGRRAAEPFVVLSISDDPKMEKGYATLFANLEHPDRRTKNRWPKVTPNDAQRRIRLGYFSADLHNHATTQLMAELFERHDRSRFEVIAFSFGPPREDAMRQRVIAAMDQFIDVRTRSDAEIAALSRELAIDIAIDLKGYTRDGRMNIFAYGAAPVQVSYLGYPGTTGAPYIDYVIADPTVIPVQMEEYYSEKVVRLPHSYQVNDRQRLIADHAFTRAELGLPEHGFVFACFNSNYKFAPESFDIWMNLLRQVPGSVLWLFQSNDNVVSNLQAEAEQRGIDKQRLVFAPRMDGPLHLARHRQADLFLDTFNYNAHTTASDALWAGLPVLTKQGNTFASRVAASLLRAIGLPELITTSNEDYAALALQLATNTELLASVKLRLSNNRLSAPLFDSSKFTLHLEAAYHTMYERRLKGLAPAHIDIAD